MDGPALSLPRHDGRRHPARPQRPAAPGRLRLRHHLRHQQRVRLRLPARQHEVRPRRDGAARPSLRDRGRSRQHPDRRSAHAADHLGSGGRIHRPLLRSRSHHPQADARRGPPGPDQGRRPRPPRSLGRLRRRRKEQDRHADRNRHGQGRATAVASHAARRPLRSGEHAAAPPRAAGAARARPLQARRAVHDQGRRRRHRRRVHRPPDAGPALERRAAPGRRSQGRRQDRARKPDARHHHLPELLPQVQEAVGHDRHGRDRGRRSSPRFTSST